MSGRCLDTRHTSQSRVKPKVEVKENPSYEDLQARVSQLEKQNKTLTQLLVKTKKQTPISPKVSLPKVPKVTSSVSGARQHVILRVAYCGHDSQELESRDKIYHYVEGTLLNALFQVSYIDAPSASSCQLKIIPNNDDLNEGDSDDDDNDGGWDSHFLLLSVFLAKIPVNSSSSTHIKQEPREDWEEEDEDCSANKIFIEVINKALPDEVRVLAWVPASNCNTHKPLTYMYFFPRANLDVIEMADAASDITSHCRSSNSMVFGFFLNSVTVSPACCVLIANDLTRPKCSPSSDDSGTTDTEEEMENVGRVRAKKKKKKMSPGFLRSGLLDSCNHVIGDDGYDMCVAVITGHLSRTQALHFMWGFFCLGQYRCSTKDILDLLTSTQESDPRAMACEEGLVLMQPEESLDKFSYWSWDKDALRSTITQLQNTWTQHAIKAAALRHRLHVLEKTLKKRSVVDDEGKKMVKDEETILPRAHCSKLMGSQELPSHKESTLNNKATHLLIAYAQPRLFWLAQEYTRRKALIEIHEDLAQNVWGLRIESVSERWMELVERYWKERRKKEECMEEESEEEVEDWQFYEDMDKLMKSGIRDVPHLSISSTLQNPRKLDTLGPSVTGIAPIAIKVHTQATDKSGVLKETRELGTVGPESLGNTGTNNTMKTDPKLLVPIDGRIQPSSSTSKPTFIIQSKSSSPSPIVIKSLMAFRTKESVSQLTGACVDKIITSPQKSKSETSTQPTCILGVSDKMSSDFLSKNSDSCHHSVSTKTKANSKPLSHFEMQVGTQKDIVEEKTQPFVSMKTKTKIQDDIKTMKVSLLHNKDEQNKILGKRTSSFVSPVPIKTRIVTQPKQIGDQKLLISLPSKTSTPQSGVTAEAEEKTAVNVKTERLHTQPITLKTNTNPIFTKLSDSKIREISKTNKSNFETTPEATASINVKTELKSHAYPITIFTKTNTKHDFSKQSDSSIPKTNKSNFDTTPEAMIATNVKTEPRSEAYPTTIKTHVSKPNDSSKQKDTSSLKPDKNKSLAISKPATVITETNTKPEFLRINDLSTLKTENKSFTISKQRSQSEPITIFTQTHSKLTSNPSSKTNFKPVVIPESRSIDMKTEMSPAESKSQIRKVIYTQTNTRTSTITTDERENKPLMIPDTVMSKINQQKPNRTVLHHVDESLFATQTGDGTKKPPDSDMSEVFLEYLIQQGEKRSDRIKEKMIHLAPTQNNKGDRQERERIDALSVKALKEIQYATSNIKNSLLGE